MEYKINKYETKFNKLHEANKINELFSNFNELLEPTTQIQKYNISKFKYLIGKEIVKGGGISSLANKAVAKAVSKVASKFDMEPIIGNKIRALAEKFNLLLTILELNKTPIGKVFDEISKNKNIQIDTVEKLFNTIKGNDLLNSLKKLQGNNKKIADKLISIIKNVKSLSLPIPPTPFNVLPFGKKLLNLSKDLYSLTKNPDILKKIEELKKLGQSIPIPELLKQTPQIKETSQIKEIPQIKESPQIKETSGEVNLTKGGYYNFSSFTFN